jgi:hypothetical protein
MAPQHESPSTPAPPARRRGLSNGPAIVIAMLVSLTAMAGLVATLDALVFNR